MLKLIFLLALMTPALYACECEETEQVYVAPVSYYQEAEGLEETTTWPSRNEDSFMDALTR